MTQMHKVSGRNTSVYTNRYDGMTEVIYHNTAVVRFNAEKIELRTGGWRSFTTKARMNQAANQFNLGFNVYQKDYDWFVDFKGETIEFNSENITLNR